MLQELRAHPWIALLVVLAHVALFTALTLNLHFTPQRAPLDIRIDPIEGDIIDAVAVDIRQLERLETERRAQQEREAQAQRDAQRRAQQEREAQAQRDAQRRAQQEREAQAQRDAQRRAQQEREAQAQRDAQLRAQQEREAQAQREAQLRAQQEREAQREAERRAQQEREAQAQREAQLRAQQEREAQAQRAQQLRERQLAEYVSAITTAVRRQWIVPPNYRPGYRATIFVRQTPVGYIQEVRLESCTGDEMFCRSVEAAVRKADPLPTPTDSSVFEREIRFTFEPN